MLARNILSLAALQLAAAFAPAYRAVNSQAHRAPSPQLLQSETPVVILPGFGNADQDYKRPFGQNEGLVSVLHRRGFEDVAVLDLPRWDWLRVAGGLADPRFWLGTQRPDAIAYGWYVRRARAAIEAASARSGGKRVLVVAHSAGGWLARAVLADGEWLSDDGRVTRANSVVSGLVTLGAPHFPPPSGSPPCATRGALAFCDAAHPGAHLTREGIFYVTVAGAAIQGCNDAPSVVEESAAPGYDSTAEARALLASAPGVAPSGVAGSSGSRVQIVAAVESGVVVSSATASAAARVAYANYKALAGDGGATGDGVIPVGVAHLAGARQVRLKVPCAPK